MISAINSSSNNDSNNSKEIQQRKSSFKSEKENIFNTLINNNYNNEEITYLIKDNNKYCNYVPCSLEQKTHFKFPNKKDLKNNEDLSSNGGSYNNTKSNFTSNNNSCKLKNRSLVKLNKLRHSVKFAKLDNKNCNSSLNNVSEKQKKLSNYNIKSCLSHNTLVKSSPVKLLNKDSKNSIIVLDNNNNNTDIIDENYNALYKYYSLFEYAFLTLCVSMLLILLLIFLKTIFKSIPFYTISATGLVMLFSLVFLINVYIKIKTIIDNNVEFDKVNSNNNSNQSNQNKQLQIGVVVSYTCFNLITLNLLIYLILISIKIISSSKFKQAIDINNLSYSNINVHINLSMMSISIPLFLGFGIAFFYFLFVLPILINYELWLDILFYGLNLCCSFIFIILLNIKIDNNYNSWITVFSPIYTLLAYNFIYLILSYFNEKDTHFKNLLIKLTSIVFIILGMILFLLNKDFNILSIKHYYSSGLVVAGFYIFIITKLVELFAVEEEDNKSVIDEENSA